MKFYSVFIKKKFLDALEITLEPRNHIGDDIWYIIGEEIFSNDDDGKKKLKDIKNRIVIIQIEAFFDGFWQTSQPTVTWGEFKRIGEIHHIDGLKNLPFEDTKIVSEMPTKEKDVIARVLGDGWKHYVTNYCKSDDRIRHYTTSITNSYRQETQSTPTEKLVDLISQKFPNYTMKQFSDVCNKCGYNNIIPALVKMF